MTDRASAVRNQFLAAAALGAVAVVAAAGTVGPLWLLGEHLRALVWGVVVMAACYLQGCLFLNLVAGSGDVDGSAFSPVLAVGMGFGLLSVELLLLGLAGFFTRPAITALVLTLFLGGLAAVRFLPVRLPGITLELEPGAFLPLGLTGLAVSFNLYMALVPPVFFDALSYHLELPSRYLLAGRVYHVSENLYSGYPQLSELLYGAGLALSGVDAAGMISLAGYLLVLGLILSWGKDVVGLESAAWAAALVSFTPPLMLLVGFYHSEWFVTFFTLTAVTLLAGRDRTVTNLMLAGCAAGFAAGSKYTALAFAVTVPALVGAALDLREGGWPAARKWWVFATVAAIVASPWYLKNLLFTGDPLYPLLSGLSGRVAGLSDLARDTHFRGFSPGDLWRWALVPFQAVFRPWKLQLPMSVGVVPVVLLPTLWSLRGSRAVNRFLLGWLAGSLAVWWATFRAGRFALPMFVLVLVWLAAGYRSAARAAPGRGRILTITVVFLIFVGFANVLGFLAAYADVLRGAFGKVSGEEYLRHTYAPYGAITYLNGLDPPPGKVLFLGEMKGFYSSFPREVATFEVPNRLLELVRDGRTPVEMARVLSDQGFTHILYNPGEMERLADKTPLLRLDGEDRKLLERFFRDGAARVYAGSGISVWKVIHE